MVRLHSQYLHPFKKQFKGVNLWQPKTHTYFKTQRGSFTQPKFTHTRTFIYVLNEPNLTHIGIRALLWKALMFGAMTLVWQFFSAVWLSRLDSSFFRMNCC